MKILINTVALTMGGGQKVAWNLISHFLTHPDPHDEYCFFCIENSEIHRLLLAHGASELLAFRFHGLFHRLLWEVFCSRKLLRKWNVDVIYSIFGYHYFSRDFPQVIGEADSNLFFPEIDFWACVPWPQRILHRMIDLYRKHMLCRADGVIFENRAMLQRGRRLFALPESRSCFVSPSIDAKEESVPVMPLQRIPAAPGTFSLLLLCGWQPHKNIGLLPEVLQCLKAAGIPIRILFSVTPDDCNSCCRDFIKALDRLGVRENVCFLGPIRPEDIPAAYAAADAVLLLSTLESFSNNIIEAWKYARPLVIADLEWSRAIIPPECGCFVDIGSAATVAREIQKLIVSPEKRAELIRGGQAELMRYSNGTEQAASILAFVKYIYRSVTGKNSV